MHVQPSVDSIFDASHFIINSVSLIPPIISFSCLLSCHHRIQTHNKWPYRWIENCFTISLDWTQNGRCKCNKKRKKSCDQNNGIDSRHNRTASSHKQTIVKQRQSSLCGKLRTDSLLFVNRKRLRNKLLRRKKKRNKCPFEIEREDDTIAVVPFHNINSTSNDKFNQSEWKSLHNKCTQCRCAVWRVTEKNTHERNRVRILAIDRCVKIDGNNFQSFVIIMICCLYWARIVY